MVRPSRPDQIETGGGDSTSSLICRSLQSNGRIISPRTGAPGQASSQIQSPPGTIVFLRSISIRTRCSPTDSVRSTLAVTTSMAVGVVLVALACSLSLASSAPTKRWSPTVRVQSDLRRALRLRGRMARRILSTQI